MIEKLITLLSRFVAAVEKIAENSAVQPTSGTHAFIVAGTEELPGDIAKVSEEPEPETTEDPAEDTPPDRQSLLARMKELVGDAFNNRVRDPKLIQAIALLEEGKACKACSGTGSASSGGKCVPCGGTGVGVVEVNNTPVENPDLDDLPLDEETPTLDEPTVRAKLMELIKLQDSKTDALAIIKNIGGAPKLEEVSEDKYAEMYRAAETKIAEVQGEDELSGI